MGIIRLLNQQGETVDYLQMIETMTPDVYERLKTAVELGKWPDGTPLTPEQRQQSLQAVIAWDQKHLPISERVGHINKGHKAGQDCDEPAAEPMSWKD